MDLVKIDSHLNFQPIKTFVESLKLWTLENELTKKETILEVINTIKYSLVESVYIRQSLFIRYILKYIFKIEYEVSDSELCEFLIDPEPEYLPQIFSIEKEQSLIHDYSSFFLEEILDLPLELKPLGSLFSHYTTSYPFSQETAREELNLLISHNQGRILFYEKWFLFFSGYVPYYITNFKTLMQDDGILPVTWRYFIALMSASTIRSSYLLRHLQEQFLIKGGDEEWLLNGLTGSKIPEKLSQLSRINNILAHQSWKLNTKDINQLLVMENKPAWSHEELVHACLIMINYHRLALVIESLKFSFAEVSTGGGYVNRSNSSNILVSQYEQKEGKNKLYNNLLEMNFYDEKIESSNINQIGNQTEIKDNHLNGVGVRRCFSKGDDVKIDYYKDEDLDIGKERYSEFEVYISNFCTLYLDYDFYSETPLSIINFNWNDEGYYILKNILSKATETINNEINFMSELTSFTIGGDFKKLDTFHFRHSIKCYIEKIFGIINDDYDYSKTNKLLLKSTKAFVKKVACMPQKISKDDISILLNTFSKEEIFHLILLASMSKQRVVLTYMSQILYEIIKSIE